MSLKRNDLTTSKDPDADGDDDAHNDVVHHQDGCWPTKPVKFWTELWTHTWPFSTPNMLILPSKSKEEEECDPTEVDDDASTLDHGIPNVIYIDMDGDSSMESDGLVGTDIFLPPENQKEKECEYCSMEYSDDEPSAGGDEPSAIDKTSVDGNDGCLPPPAKFWNDVSQQLLHFVKCITSTHIVAPNWNDEEAMAYLNAIDAMKCRRTKLQALHCALEDATCTVFEGNLSPNSYLDTRKDDAYTYFPHQEM